MGEPCQCRICGLTAEHEHFTAREMMFGTREEFDYFRCIGCGTLQISAFPADIARHYDASSYYSFNNDRARTPLKKLFRRAVAGYMIGHPERYPSTSSRWDRLKRKCEPWIAQIPGLTRASSILDVGCGEGTRLALLAGLGFTKLNGVDPFMPAERARRSDINLMRGDLSEVQGAFDLIMMHHSLEHFEDPGHMLTLARSRLSSGGRLFVRLPVLQQTIWERFGTNWAQLDAPRHYYLFPSATFIEFASRHGLRCISYGFATQAWALAWSEAYQRNQSPADLSLTKADMDRYQREAVELNAAGAGEEGWFVLEASNN